MHDPLSYLRVFGTFARNSLIRDMTFRVNFLIECISSMSWTAMNLGFYLLVFQYTNQIGEGTGWGQYEFFVFLATTWLVNSLVQAFFMPNAEEFSELIRTGGLDFALLKPIDTQFLISFHKVDWSSLANFVLGLALLVYSLSRLVTRATDPLALTPLMVVLYIFYLGCGAVILYSLMIVLAATSIWLGRNQSLYNFWFYITNFSRYPMEIYSGAVGGSLRVLFTYIVPVLVVVNVPARILAKPLEPRLWWEWPLAGFAVFATAGSVLVSRRIFNRALVSYRSASS
ncbi:MAG: ABC-2 family transporter protein [Planctomycetes bacterium]|nr:ABC-2 family transporter protein [Planctomycetota bacterium]